MGLLRADGGMDAVMIAGPIKKPRREGVGGVDAWVYRCSGSSVAGKGLGG